MVARLSGARRARRLKCATFNGSCWAEIKAFLEEWGNAVNGNAPSFTKQLDTLLDEVEGTMASENEGSGADETEWEKDEECSDVDD